MKSEKWGDWCRWLQEHGLKRTTAWEAATLYERAGSEDAIANLTPDEAKRRYGITRRPRKVVEPHNETQATCSLGSNSDSTNLPVDDSEDENTEDSDPSDEDFNYDDPVPEPDDLAKPPRSVKTMLIAVSNLLLSCEQRSCELNEECRKPLDEITACVSRLRKEMTP